MVPITTSVRPDYESILTVGTLFTDEHLAEMIGHPLFCLGVDTFTVQAESVEPNDDAEELRLLITDSRPTNTHKCSNHPFL